MASTLAAEEAPISSPTFLAATDFTLRQEGKYNPGRKGDKGGETNFGISKRSYPQLNIRKLKRKDAVGIYKKDYWDTIQGDNLPPDVATVMFDMAVNAGVGQASKHLQQVIGADADGVIGPRTLRRLENHLEKQSSHDLALHLLDKRKWFYRRISARDKNLANFLPAWLARTESLRKMILDDSATRRQAVVDTIANKALQ